jgi:FtsP/CotA-like multicopper oxidase with cupredoxin domain
MATPSFSRRRVLLAGAAATTLTAALPRRLAAQIDAPVDLTVTRRTIEVNGRAASVYRLGRADGTPSLDLPTGRFRVQLTNRTAEATSVHWHGLLPPYGQDGVPDLPQPPLPPGQTYSYDFALDTPGTHWMHAHTLQEQELLAAPLIVTDPAEAGRDEQPVVMLFHDFSFRSPEELLTELKASGGHGGAMAGMPGHGMHGMTGMGADAASGMAANHGGRSSDEPDMDLDDTNDIDFDAYLANDRTLDDPAVFRVERGGVVRLRLINGATATAFWIDIGELEGEAIAVDGNPSHPVGGRLFPLGMGQRIDIRVRLPSAEGTWPILALREGALERAGFLLATKGLPIRRISGRGEHEVPVLDLALEARLAAAEPLAGSPESRRVTLELTGDMARYLWGIGGRSWNDHQPIIVRAGERIEVTMRNTSMMGHPMHLHGHHFQVVAIDGRRLAGAMRDTVWVPPKREVTIAFDAANPGRWPFHCHHLYHMAAGMMTEVFYAA